ncbi:DNA-binding transcriptional MerR regulator [Nocardia transvalensis]|uniref:DNA-binding transcriptional MerR regulator n=1 Tax=Nocardia transvalensis TaxID=37333 RepID=A0A7W9P932_9NOCA|nr:MerR family transcriptional regulator [Nocardia transvalensis]MBB5911438.1 DNA-binding transcriptional MerR regulator [Nocardia transvalensis]
MPARSAPESDVGYTVRAVADRLGIPTATLRSWNHRYDIGPPRHRPGAHRLYTEADIAQVARMLDLIRAGASPAGAAAAVRAPAVDHGDRGPLLTAAFTSDAAMVSELLTAHFRAHGVADTWNTLCRPAFADIVAQQLEGVGCIDVEHLLSWCITSVLQRVAPPPMVTGAPGVVLACTSGETHSLPLEVLRAALAERGVGSLMLGPDVPTGALTDALARRAEPTSVVLWSQQESTALASAVRACVTARARVLVGGPGWDAVLLPEAVIQVGSLRAAVDLLG